jgi:hypothetical protein
MATSGFQRSWVHIHSIILRALRQRATHIIDMAVEPEEGVKLAHGRLQSTLPVRAKTRRQTITSDGTPGLLCLSNPGRRQTAIFLYGGLGDRDARLRLDFIGAKCECTTPVLFVLSHTAAAQLLANSCSPLRFAWTTRRRSERGIFVRLASCSQSPALADLTTKVRVRAMH